MDESAIRARMRDARERKKISRRKLGDLLGYSDKTILNYETGDRGLPYAELAKWAESTDTSLRWLLFGTEDGANSDQVIRLLEALRDQVDQLRRDLLSTSAGERPAHEIVREGVAHQSQATPQPDRSKKQAANRAARAGGSRRGTP